MEIKFHARTITSSYTLLFLTFKNVKIIIKDTVPIVRNLFREIYGGSVQKDLCNCQKTPGIINIHLGCFGYNSHTQNRATERSVLSILKMGGCIAKITG